MRICITGGPCTGKTTLAAQMAEIERDDKPDRPWGGIIRHTDDLIPLGWSEASQAACLWLDAPGPWIIEGVAVSRALRKWRDAHPGEPPPVDRVIYLTEPLNRGAVLAGQDRMAKGVASVHAEIEEWLVEHGVATERKAIQVFGDDPTFLRRPRTPEEMERFGRACGEQYGTKKPIDEDE